MDKVRFGIIGVGGMGSHHAAYMNSVEGACLAAVCDIDRERLARAAARHNVPAFERSDDLLASGKVDAVLIATPHYFHPPIARAAFARGLHVLSEKPIAVGVKEARLTDEAHAKVPHLKFGIMYQTRTNAMYRKMRELVADGELGPIGRITWIVTNWFRTRAYYASGGWRATWTGEGGGVLINQCPHNLDLLQWVSGMMPRRVTAVASIAKTHPIEVEDEVSAILEYDNGAVGHFITSTGEAPGTNRLEICGDRGKLVAESGKLVFHRLRRSAREINEKSPESFPHAEAWPIEVPYNASAPERHQAITQNFVRAILHDEPLLAPGVEGVRGLEIGNAMLMSGLTRRAVDLPVDGDAYEQFIKDLAARYGGKKALQARAGGVGDVGASFQK